MKPGEPSLHFAVNLLRYLVVPTFVVGTDGRLLAWNQACERLTGVPGAEILGTQDHWRAFYRTQRPCLADLVVQGRQNDIPHLYVAHDDPHGRAFAIHAENWCVMPRLGTELYLSIDAGPIYDDHGHMVAVIETLRDMTDEMRAKAELERLVMRDGLTGLSNRRHFDQSLERLWAQMRRDRLPLSLLMVDVDHFKRYNDLYGHVAGDQCLREIARVLEAALLRPSDVAARFGGEEFAVLLPNTDHHGAEQVAQRIWAQLSALRLPHAEGEQGQVTLSIGLSTLQPDRSINSNLLVEQADAALYDAKRTGRNRYTRAGAATTIPPPPTPS